MYTDAKPGSPSEILAHHGVKGMRWGVRSRSTRQFRAAHPTRSSRTRAIQTARVKRESGRKISASDEAVARRLTAGEKIVLGTLVASGVFTVPITVMAGINVANRRHFERLARKGQ